MKKRIVLTLLLAALVLGAAWIDRGNEPRLGCRIYADDELIYESTGTRLEDILVSLDPELTGVERIRVEYVGENGERILAFPTVYLDLTGA